MGFMSARNVSARLGKMLMDHKELMTQINKRLDETDQKIDRNDNKLDDLKNDLHSYNIKTAILETKMSGIIGTGLLIVSAIIGIISFGIKKGLF